MELRQERFVRLIEPIHGAALAFARGLCRSRADGDDLFQVFEIEGWKIDEIAAMHGISESAVKSRLARGRDRLRAFYAKKLGVTDAAPPILLPEDNL